ncbi:hypothetical protein N9C10_01655 [Flavobacteriaceae bacterium]|nr:hypothetical protein [Flavobacteriaceae bacterium]
MPSLVSLHSENPGNHVLNRYMNCSKESYSKGKFWLGGQLQMKIDEPITEQHFVHVLYRNENEMPTPANQWELASMQRAEVDFSEFRSIYYDYMRKLRYRGLFRAIVFWLAPARKRAAEKVFHPQRLLVEGYFNVDV